MCPCQKNSNPFIEKELYQLINFQFQQILIKKTLDINIIQYVFFLKDVTYNVIQARSVLLSRKKTIKSQYYIILLEVIDRILKIKVQIDLNQAHHQEEFIEELKTLQLEGTKLQHKMVQLFDQYLRLYDQLKSNTIKNFGSLYNQLIHLKQQTMIIVKLGQEMSLYNNNDNQIKNIFTLRISHLISFSLQNLKEQIENQIKIDEIFQNDIYKLDEFTNLAFSQNKATSIIAELSEKQSGRISHQLTVNQKVFFQYYNNTIEQLNISEFIDPTFRQSHNNLINQYLKTGKSKIIGSQFESFISNGDKEINPVKVMLFPYLSQNNSNIFEIIAYILKTERKNHSFIHLDYNFNLQASDKKFRKLLESYQINFDQINIFQIFPQLKDNLKLFHIQNSYKSMYFQNQSIQILNKFNRPMLNKKLNILILEQNSIQQQDQLINCRQQLEKLDNIDISGQMNTLSVEVQSYVDYEISIKILQYTNESGNQEYYINYQLVIDLTQFYEHNQQFDKENTDEILKQKLVIDSKTKSKISKVQQDQEEEMVVRSLHSRNSTTTVARNSNDLHIFITSQTMPSSILQFIVLSVVNASLTIIGLALFYILLEKKREEQDVCFNNLFYGTEFLDYYGLILKGSRHTVFYRDFNKFLDDEQIVQINQTYQISITKSDKISFALNLYVQNCKNLISLYENYQSYLNGYQSEIEIQFKYVDYEISQVNIQTINTQAAYYELMNSLFYLAIKTFASDPSLYLKGTLDTFSQINTRSILYLNFNDVCDLTQQFMETCLSNSEEYNNSFDSQVTIIFYLFYSIIVILYILQIITISRIIYKMKQILQLFQRLDTKDLEEQSEKLQYIYQNIQQEEFWFNSKFFSNFYEISQDMNNNKGQQQTFTIKLDDEFNQPLYYILQSFILVVLIVFFIIFQVQYNIYSNEINPIVNNALQAIQMRLNFIKLTSNWDVYNYQLYYSYNVEIKNNDPLMNKNIQGDNKILQHLTINITQMQESMETQMQEPFTNLTYNLDTTTKSELLLNDICLISNCNMITDILNNRILTDELIYYYQVGIIQIYQQTFSVMQNLDVNVSIQINITEYLNQFIDLIYSTEYFIYIFWGLDLTNYQLKLFSDYFVQLAKNELTSSTKSVVILYFVFGILLTIVLIIIIITLNYKIITNYLSLKFCLRFIPLKVMVNKNIIKQIKTIQ